MRLRRAEHTHQTRSTYGTNIPCWAFIFDCFWDNIYRVAILATLFCALLCRVPRTRACAHIRAHKRYNRYLFIILLLYIYRKQECNYRKAEKVMKRKRKGKGWNDGNIKHKNKEQKENAKDEKQKTRKVWIIKAQPRRTLKR